jgi:quinol monooxygenase YgiN
MAVSGWKAAVASASIDPTSRMIDSLFRPGWNAVIVFINVFQVDPSNQQRLVDILTKVTGEIVSKAPGFISSTLHRSTDGSKVTMYAKWASLADYEAMRQDPAPRPYLEEALSFATFDPGMYEVVGEFRSKTTDGKSPPF